MSDIRGHRIPWLIDNSIVLCLKYMWTGLGACDSVVLSTSAWHDGAAGSIQEQGRRGVIGVKSVFRHKGLCISRDSEITLMSNQSQFATVKYH